MISLCFRTDIELTWSEYFIQVYATRTHFLPSNRSSALKVLYLVSPLSFQISPFQEELHFFWKKSAVLVDDCKSFLNDQTVILRTPKWPYLLNFGWLWKHLACYSTLDTSLLSVEDILFLDSSHPVWHSKLVELLDISSNVFVWWVSDLHSSCRSYKRWRILIFRSMMRKEVQWLMGLRPCQMFTFDENLANSLSFGSFQ